MNELREKAAVLALVEATTSSGPWHRTAALIEQRGSALRLLDRDWSELEGIDPREVELIVAQVTPATIDRMQSMILGLQDQGVQTVTVLDPDYPANLRDIYNLPPMLFVRGKLVTSDDRAIAVVGTRSPSRAGLEQAGRLARGLVERGVTVLSGLAKGIDSAAHEAALVAGGRTIAVMGTGILRVYPADHVELAQRIEANGAVVSQFWPDAPPTRYSFPMRNVVMSGMAIGTAVVEAGPTSGAKMQARLALEHGKRVFLVKSLVLQQEWARRYAEHPGATVVNSADEIVPLVEQLAKPEKELTLF